MTIPWACALSVPQYAALGREAPVPRPRCPGCGAPMAFDGACRRQVREAGVVYEVFVRRARCRPCGELETLPPDFVCHGRLDSVSSIGAHLLGHAGVVSDEAAAALLAGVPARTRRSWR